MDRSEAIKRLLTLHSCTGVKPDVTLCQSERNAIDMAISALREQPRWISVDERLPEDDALVLCIGKKGGMFLGFIRDYHEIQGGAYTYVPNARGARYATHWMPLPSAPEVEV